MYMSEKYIHGMLSYPRLLVDLYWLKFEPCIETEKILGM